MGYTTDFSGSISIRPKLPDDYVRLFNEIAGKRNNTYGDGEEGSFDHLFHENLGRPDPNLKQLEGPSNVPSCWCQWNLQNEEPLGDTTELIWDGGEKFYEYEGWLAYVIALVKRDFPKSRFSGEIEWEGEEPGDLGKFTVDDSGGITVHTGHIAYEVAHPVPDRVAHHGLKSHRVMSRVVLAKIG